MGRMALVHRKLEKKVDDFNALMEERYGSVAHRIFASVDHSSGEWVMRVYIATLIPAKEWPYKDGEPPMKHIIIGEEPATDFPSEHMLAKIALVM